MDSLDTNIIKKMTIIKGEKEITKYTDKKNEGVIIIDIKKN
jgi:hypothetical protein